MHEATDRVLEAVENGKLSRREAVGRLVALAAATFAGRGMLAQSSSAPQPTFEAAGLNHLALRVTDVARSRDFYGKHLGLGVLRDSSQSCFMSAGKNNFVALFRSETPGLDHYCYTVANYRASDAVRTLDAAGLKARRREDRVYFDDPDGIEVQLASEWGDYPGERR